MRPGAVQSKCSYFLGAFPGCYPDACNRCPCPPRGQESLGGVQRGKRVEPRREMTRWLASFPGRLEGSRGRESTRRGKSSRGRLTGSATTCTVTSTSPLASRAATPTTRCASALRLSTPPAAISRFWWPSTRRPSTATGANWCRGASSSRTPSGSRFCPKDVPPSWCGWP